MKRLTGAVALIAWAGVAAIISSWCLAAGPRSQVAFDMVIVSDSEFNAQGKLPASLLELMVPFAGSAGCAEFEFYPRPKLIRADTVPPDTVELDGNTDYETLKGEAWEAMPATKRLLGAEPEFTDIVTQARRKLENVRVAAGQPTASGLKEDSLENAFRAIFEENAADIAFVVKYGGNVELSRYVKILKGSVPEGAKVEVVKTASAVNSNLSQQLCITGDNGVEAAQAPGVLVMLAARKVVGNGGGGGGGGEGKPGEDATQHVRQGLTYISLAKGARGAQEKRENYRNAEASFTAAIDAGNQQGACYANAYMNRGLVHALQDKPSLALRDLNKAVECDPEDATIRYNLGVVHSLSGDKDLSLEALDAALTRGFSDCDALRDDPDLKNVRRMPEYKRTLEKHKLFCF